MDLSNIITIDSLLIIIDILVVSFLIYRLIMIIKDTRAFNLFRGIIAIIAMKIGSDLLHLYTLSWIMEQVIAWGVLATIIIFQPEIRQGLEHLGRGNMFKKTHNQLPSNERVVESIVEAVKYMSKRSIGALICIEMNSPLDEYIATGIPLQATISSQLLINIFIPNTPLHDGALIIRDNKIVTASSYLPLSKSLAIPKELGTRHRAAIGLSEITDAITIIVSEETGGISVARMNHLYRDISLETLSTILKEALRNNDTSKLQQKQISFVQEMIDTFSRGGKSRHG